MTKKVQITCMAFILIMCLLAMLMFGGCGNKSETEDKSGSSQSESYPDKEITLIVPFSAGGSVDRMARILADHWPDKINTSMVVQNKEGSGGELGYKYFMNSEPDGHSVLIGVDPYLSISILRGANYNLDDFAFINVQQFDPVSITVRADSPYSTLEELIEAIKKDPGTFTYGTTAGGALQIVGRSLQNELDIEVREVTYDGGGDIRTALLSGEVDFATSGTTGDINLGDEVKILAIASSKTFPVAPELPLLNDELKPYNASISDNGSTRFVAVHKEFKEEYPEKFEKLVESYKLLLEDSEYREILKKTNDEKITVYYGPDESEELMNNLFASMEKFKDIVLGEK